VARQQLRARDLVLHQHHAAHGGGQRIDRLAHLLARGEQHQGAVFHARQVGEQGLDHLGGELHGVLRVGVGLGGDQGALGGVVERAGHFERGGGIHAVQARFAQEEVELPAARERGGGQHRAAHAAP
jgi:hypothetical protein